MNLSQILFRKRIKTMKKTFYLTLAYSCCFSGLSISLSAENLAVLPFRVNHYRYQGNLPINDASPENNGVQMARAAWLMLRLMNMPDLVRPAEAEGLMKSMRFSAEKKITLSDLKKAAKELDAEKLLLFSVKGAGEESVIESKIYYAHSGQITDSITTHETNIWKNIQKNLYERFPTKRIHINSDSGSALLIIAEASGGTFREFGVLKKQLMLTDYSKYGACLVNHAGQSSEMKFSENKKLFTQNLSKQGLRGGEKKLKNFSRVFECAQKRIQEAKTMGTALKVVVIASGEPDSGAESVRTKKHLRQIAQNASDLVVLLSSNADPQAHFYWQNTVNEIKNSGPARLTYTLIRIRAGLSDGTQWNIFKRGLRIVETADEWPSAGAGNEIPAAQQATANAETLVQIYSKMSGNKVVSASQPQWIFLPEVLSPAADNKKKNKSATARVAMRQNQVNFFLDFPVAQLRSPDIQPGKTVDFAISVRRGKKGFPLENLKGFGLHIADASGSSTPLLLDVRSFMKNPDKYLGQSFADGNLFIIRTEILSVKFPEEDVIE